MWLQRWPIIVLAIDLIPDELLFHCNCRFITHLYIYIGLLLQWETIQIVFFCVNISTTGRHWFSGWWKWMPNSGSVSGSVSGSASGSVSGSVCLWLCLCIWLCLSLTMALSQAMSLAYSVSVCLWLCLCLSLALSLFVSGSVSVCLWFCLWLLLCLWLAFALLQKQWPRPNSLAR